MSRVDVTINLPQELAERAQSAGLLTNAEVERWLVDELDRQQRLNRFFGKLDKLQSIDPPLTPEEIDAEITAYRRDKGDQ